MNREYHRWYSPRLERDMELLIFGHAGAKVLAFPTRAGRFYDYENMGLIGALSWKIEAGHLQVWCVDSVDAESFYCFWAHPSGRIRRHIQYEEYILNEVLPFMQWKNPHECTIAHGCSFGAYHAANIAFRHPHLFRKVAAFSGRYDPTHAVDSFRDLMDGYYDDLVYFNTPTHFLPNLTDPWRLDAMRRIDWVFVVGREDPFLGNNLHLSSILNGKGIPHRLHIWDGRAHSPRAWRHMASLYV